MGKSRNRIREGETVDPKKIKQFRKRFGLTAKSLSELMGVSIATVWAWESGRRNPSKSAELLLLRIEKELEEKMKTKKRVTK